MIHNLKNVRRNKHVLGFTIVELLIVIVIIGILAAITVVSYTGITKKANEATIKSDLVNATKKLNMYYAEHDNYPDSIDTVTNCPVPADTNYCLKPGSGITLTYEPTLPGKQDFTLTANKGTIAYKTTKSTPPVTIANLESFVKTWGGALEDQARSIVNTSDGGYIIAGSSFSYSIGNSDTYLAKYSSDGNLSWSRTWGGSGADSASSVIQTNDGGYIIIGSVYNLGAGGDDAFVAKYTSNGNLSWNKTWGGTGGDYANSIIQTSTGEYVIAGSSYSYNGGDAILVKFTADGSLVWNKNWGGSNTDYITSVINTNDNGLAVTGYTSSFGAGSDDAFIAKYTSDGNLVWNKTWGGNSSDVSKDIVQNPDSTYVIAGSTNGYGAGNNDSFVAKYTSDGTLLWNKTWGGSGNDYSESAIKAYDNNYVVAGFTYSFGAGGIDSYLLKYDTNGNLLWNKTWGGSGDDLAFSTTQTITNSILSVGYTNSYGSGGVDSLIVKHSANGAINNCTTPMCQTPTATVTTPSATITTPSATVSSPTATITTPTATITSPSATVTTVVAP